MSAETFRKMAREASTQAAQLDRLARSLDELASRTTDVIGGTATRQDKALLGHAAAAAAAAKSSARAFRQASDHARKAAIEAEQKGRERAKSHPQRA